MLFMKSLAKHDIVSPGTLYRRQSAGYKQHKRLIKVQTKATRWMPEWTDNELKKDRQVNEIQVRMYDLINEYMNEWRNKWMDGWISEWVH